MATTQENLRESFFNKHPRKWDYAVIIALMTMLSGTVGYIVSSELTDHNHDREAHPSLSEQLDSVEAKQLRAYILHIDSLLCEDNGNEVYRRELAEHIDEYEKLTGRSFPRELLRCVR
jgi:hypothetical protein